MQEARILEVHRIEYSKSERGFYYDLTYSLTGKEYRVEIFREYSTLVKGDIIYI